jgi:acetyl-CoA carboxylase biotin carboxyl carrier protein
MDLKKIQKLLQIIAESGIAEVEIEEDGLKLTVRTQSPTVQVQSAYPMPPMGYPPQGYPMAAPPAMPYGAQFASPMPASAIPTGAALPPAPVESAPPVNEVTVRAPIVGTYYSAASPETGPYVTVGDRVKEGDVLCIIEAMKLMNEIECETAGTITRILVENANPVEYDQPLFAIATDG